MEAGRARVRFLLVGYSLLGLRLVSEHFIEISFELLHITTLEYSESGIRQSICNRKEKSRLSFVL
jgi:hypothetical protein